MLFSRFVVKICFFLLFSVVLFVEGCSEPGECKNGISTLSINPDNSACSSNCECNNQLYTGFCDNGLCKAILRGSCQGKGTKLVCVPVGVNCETGIKVCGAPELEQLVWGDCVCSKTVECKPNETKECYPPKEIGCKEDGKKFACKGSCKAGKRICQKDGKWGECKEAVGPKKETCNNKDDNCDGRVDEALEETCKGGCGAGKKVCKDGKWGSCVPDKNTRVCRTRCGAGEEVCKDGKWGSCNTPNSAEVCDNKDNNCDGKVDEKLDNCSQVQIFSTLDAKALPVGMVLDKSGNLLVADTRTHRILKVLPDGKMEILAGTGRPGFQDGPGTQALFRTPVGLVLDQKGVLFVADSGNNRIRTITPDGKVSTYAGDGKCIAIFKRNCFKNGPKETAQLFNPTDLVFDKKGNLFFSEKGNHLIRKVDTKGIVSTFVGSRVSGNVDGKGESAKFNEPSGLVIDSKGNLFASDSKNNKIRKITPDGTVSTFAGSGAEGRLDELGVKAGFRRPGGLSIDNSDNIYVADTNNYSIRRIDPFGNVKTIGGGGLGQTGTPTSAFFAAPSNVLYSSKNKRLYVADSSRNKIRHITFK